MYTEQDPAKADKITKIQRDLDETTEVLVRNKIRSFTPSSVSYVLPVR